MPRPKREWRGDQIECAGHDQWHHHSRFNRRQRQTPEGPIWHYDPNCKLWIQTQRVASKHEDEALRIVENRAKRIIAEANRVSDVPKVGIDFVMGALNYKSLVPMVRATLVWGDECVCPNCASGYDKPVEFDHREPPRHPRDWARLHARNIGPLDRECNGSKNDMPYGAWLDLEEDKRLSAQAHNTRLATNGLVLSSPPPAPVPKMQSLF